MVEVLEPGDLPRGVVSVGEIGLHIGNTPLQNSDAFDAAMADIVAAPGNSGQLWQFGAGVYNFSRGHTVNQTMVFQGIGGGGPKNPTHLKFPDGSGGIKLGLGAGYSMLRDLVIRGEYHSWGADADGVTIEVNHVTIQNCAVFDFPRHNIHIDGTDGKGADFWRLINVRTENAGSCGLYVHGYDANCGVAVAVDATSNALDHTRVGQDDGWGFYESSFLGNVYEGCHSAENGHGPIGGAYKCDGPTNVSTFVHCYSEVGQNPSLMDSCLVVGGNHGAKIIGTATVIRASGKHTRASFEAVSDGQPIDIIIGNRDHSGRLLQFQAQGEAGELAFSWAKDGGGFTGFYGFNYGNGGGWDNSMLIAGSQSKIDGVPVPQGTVVFPKGFYIGKEKVEP